MTLLFGVTSFCKKEMLKFKQQYRDINKYFVNEHAVIKSKSELKGLQKYLLLSYLYRCPGWEDGWWPGHEIKAFKIFLSSRSLLALGANNDLAEIKTKA